MRYTDDKRSLVRSLRSEGASLNMICHETAVPKSTIREWIKDIRLTNHQKFILQQKVAIALQDGRKLAQAAIKDARIQKENQLKRQGIEEIGDLTKRELFIAGVALYWAEGFKNKHEKRLGFCNSDPEMILFYLNWLKEVLAIGPEKITARLTINIAYKDKSEEIEEYWSALTGIPRGQFTKAFYQTALWKKKFTDMNYHGVLRIHVHESLEELLKMRGWIDGMKKQRKKV